MYFFRVASCVCVLVRACARACVCYERFYKEEVGHSRGAWLVIVLHSLAVCCCLWEPEVEERTEL